MAVDDQAPAEQPDHDDRRSTGIRARASQSRQDSAGKLRGGLAAGGATGNERLTTAAGAMLIVLLAVIGVTIVRIHSLLWLHLFVGMLLVGPVLLKMASTGYRFVRYYTANQRYRLKGPPEPALRLLAPFVVVATVVVFASGIALLLAGPGSRETLFPIHKFSFFVWVALTTLHVLAHLPAMPAMLRADYGPSAQLSGDVTGRAGRILALGGALVAGAVLAILLIPEFGPWLHLHRGVHH